ncbi:MAG TPA: hypothetical protein VGR93_11785 [Candidatus Acidoferrales bacterium]|nr:hypothetical protein [Candidatus Acidoferrales bacterium]
MTIEEKGKSDATRESRGRGKPRPYEGTNPCRHFHVELPLQPGREGWGTRRR